MVRLGLNRVKGLHGAQVWYCMVRASSDLV